MYNEDVKRRVLSEADYILKTGDTLRGTASVFGVGKSTVHNDLTVKLKYFDSYIYESVRTVIEKNLSERHIRGGNATKLKYLEIKKQKFKRSTT